MSLFLTYIISGVNEGHHGWPSEADDVEEVLLAEEEGSAELHHYSYGNECFSCTRFYVHFVFW